MLLFSIIFASSVTLIGTTVIATTSIKQEEASRPKLETTSDWVNPMDKRLLPIGSDYKENKIKNKIQVLQDTLSKLEEPSKNLIFPKQKKLDSVYPWEKLDDFINNLFYKQNDSQPDKKLEIQVVEEKNQLQNVELNLPEIKKLEIEEKIIVIKESDVKTPEENVIVIDEKEKEIEIVEVTTIVETKPTPDSLLGERILQYGQKEIEYFDKVTETLHTDEKDNLLDYWTIEMEMEEQQQIAETFLFNYAMSFVTSMEIKNNTLCKCKDLEVHNFLGFMVELYEKGVNYLEFVDLLLEKYTKR